MDYKKYSLEQLDNWIHDAMSAGEATPQEIYDVIVNVVKDNYYTHKKQASEAYELLALLNGNGKGHIKEFDDCVDKILTYDGNDTSPKSKKAWNDFWEENYYPEEVKKDDGMRPWGHSDLEYMIANPTLTEDRVSNFPGEQYTEEELNAMSDKAASDEERDKCRECKVDGYTRIDDVVSISPQEKDEVVKWKLPVQVDGLTGECYVLLPDDLLERAGLKEGDVVNWIDREDGSFEMRKVTKPLEMDEC